MVNAQRFHGGHGAGIIALVAGLGVALLLGLLIWRIWSKAGHRGIAGILCFVPLVNLGALIYLAFSPWPIERELAVLRQPGHDAPPESSPPATPDDQAAPAA